MSKTVNEIWTARYTLSGEREIAIWMKAMELERAVDRLKRGDFTVDAERYRWLRDECHLDWRQVEDKSTLLPASMVDAAIDRGRNR